MWFTLLLPVLSSLIDRIFPDKAKADEAKIELQKALNEAEAKITEAKKDVITTEINKGGWASQWRAYLMMVCISIVAYNWVAVSILNVILVLLGVPAIVPMPVPPELWTLVTIGLGGYLGKETMSTYAQAKYGTDDTKFFDILRKKIFKSGMSQEQVDALEEALKARDGNG